MGLLQQGLSFKSVVGSLISFMNMLVGVLVALALVIFLWGLVRYIYHSDDAHNREEGRTTILWGLVALFVLISIFGILQILNTAFFGGTASTGSVNVGNTGGTAGNLSSSPIY